jgi:hypothetical protein
VAQKGGGGRGGGGVPGLGPVQLSRLDALEAAFKLTKDQKKAVKAILDEAHKNAAPIRDGLMKTRAALGGVIQGNKGQPDIDQAAKAYAEQASAMASLEMRALAQVLKALDKDQMANNQAISSAFFLIRGAFLDNKKWDDVPDGKLY